MGFHVSFREGRFLRINPQRLTQSLPRLQDLRSGFQVFVLQNARLVVRGLWFGVFGLGFQGLGFKGLGFKGLGLRH